MPAVEDRYIHFIQDVLITIHENQHEIMNRKIIAEPEELDYIEAKLAIYREMLSIIRMSAREFNLPCDKLGI
jgi:hypothetical protein